MAQNDVLIIEDEKDIREICDMYLKDMGMFRHIVFAKDGLEAMLKLSNQEFGIILVDINVPKKNGMEVVREIAKSDTNHIHSVIIMSGTLNKDRLSKVVHFGVKEFLVKPFDQARFIEVVKKVFDQLN